MQSMKIVYVHSDDPKAKPFHDKRIQNLKGIFPQLVAASREEEVKDIKEKYNVAVLIFGSARLIRLAEKFSSTCRILIYADPNTQKYQETQHSWHSLGAYHCPTEDTVTATLSSPEFIPKLVLIAHNGMKEDLANFLSKYKDLLEYIPLMATETTGKYLIENNVIGEGDIVRHNDSGPTGGDTQVGAAIPKGGIGAVIFFKDHLMPHPHESDIKALDRNCDIWEIPLATNEATARMMMEYISLIGWENFVNQRSPKKPKQVQKQKTNQNNLLKPSNSNNLVQKQKHSKIK